MFLLLYKIIMLNILKKKERRNFERLNVYHLIKYRLVSDDSKKLVLSSVKDISGGGVRLSAESDIPKGSIVQVYINAPQFSSSIPCLAKVAWSRKIGKSNKYELGFEFLEIEDLLRNDIIQRIHYVRRRSKQG